MLWEEGTEINSFSSIFDVHSSLETVWAFYTNIRHLEKITPPYMLLRVLDTSDEIMKEGSEAWLTGKIIFRNKWHSKITFFKPFRYVDEMITSENDKPIFSHWKHEHIFVGDEMQTRVIDNIQFELPLGVIGRIFRQYAKAKLRNLFNYRAAATKRLLEQERYI